MPMSGTSIRQQPPDPGQKLHLPAGGSHQRIRSCADMVPRVGFEPTAYRSRGGCAPAVAISGPTAAGVSCAALRKSDVSKAFAPRPARSGVQSVLDTAVHHGERLPWPKVRRGRTGKSRSPRRRPPRRRNPARAPPTVKPGRRRRHRIRNRNKTDGSLGTKAIEVDWQRRHPQRGALVPELCSGEPALAHRGVVGRELAAARRPRSRTIYCASRSSGR